MADFVDGIICFHKMRCNFTALILALLLLRSKTECLQVALSRGLAILSEMPIIVTLLDLGTGTAAFQNSRSRAYWGELRQAAAFMRGRSPSSPLNHGEVSGGQGFQLM